jgi:hypothetical protein
VRRVPRYFRNSRLVDVAKVHYALCPHCQIKSDWGVGPKALH